MKLFKVTALVRAPISIDLTRPWDDKAEVGAVLEEARREAERKLNLLLQKEPHIRVGGLTTVQIVGEPTGKQT